MKTNLQKILTVSGYPGLYKYVAQANAGVVVESLSDNKRMVCGMSAKLSSLSDISVFTDEGEVKLQQLLEKMREKLGEESAPSGKSDAAKLKSFFEEVLPDYDRDRFYTSHMKKVVDWYNNLKEFATLEFLQEGEEEVSE
ncbi:MAG: DUF5606 domain-containing protein [Bacteroidales bacterium]|jgi:hypothetical protein|nr:DUF5606 domain-containing protein [Bacteroidales bacterium]